MSSQNIPAESLPDSRKPLDASRLVSTPLAEREFATALQRRQGPGVPKTPSPPDAKAAPGTTSEPDDAPQKSATEARLKNEREALSANVLPEKLPVDDAQGGSFEIQDDFAPETSTEAAVDGNAQQWELCGDSGADPAANAAIAAGAGAIHVLPGFDEALATSGSVATSASTSADGGQDVQQMASVIEGMVKQLDAADAAHHLSRSPLQCEVMGGPLRGTLFTMEWGAQPGASQLLVRIPAAGWPQFQRLRSKLLARLSPALRSRLSFEQQNESSSEESDASA